MTLAKLRKYIAWGLPACFLVAMVIYSQTVLKAQICKGIEIVFINGDKYPFLKAKEIEQLATSNTSLTLAGTKLSNIDLHQIEKNVQAHPSIATCEANLTHGEKVQLTITYKKPIARLIYNFDFPSKYVDASGKLFNTSHNYTAKVPIISGKFIDQSCTKTLPASLAKLLNRIESEQFWKSQIASIYIDDTTNIEMVPLIGSHMIAYGSPHQIENKLAKLKLFYQNIYGSPETAHYTSVSVAYDGQIVCK
jgi:cell division protein FtsQ